MREPRCAGGEASSLQHQVLHGLETTLPFQYSSLKCWSMGMRVMSLLQSRAGNYKSF